MTLKELHDATTIFTTMNVYEGWTCDKPLARLGGISEVPEELANRLVSVIDIFRGELQVHVVDI